MADTTLNDKLSFWRKVGFGIGDIYGGGSGVVISFYYLYFLTDVIRLNPALAGTVILISKIYDAITDPLEGIIGDRTRTRFGRRRPYLLAGIPLIFLSFFFLFYPVSLEQEWARFAVVILAYLFFSTIVSFVMVSYNALASELTLDYHERTSISSARIFFSTVSSVLSALLPLEIVKMFSDVRTGYIVMGLAFGVFFALPFIITFFATKERKEFQKPPTKFNMRRSFIEPFQVKTFVYVLLMYILAFVAMDIVSSIVIYYMKYFLLRGNEANYVSGTLLVMQVVSLPFYVWLSRRTSKKTGYMVGTLVWIASMSLSFLIVPDAPGFMVYLFAVMVGFGTGGIVVMIYAMFPDIPDVDELKTGERREGIYAAMVTFMRKFSSAIAIFLVSNVLAFSGYKAPVEQVTNGITKLIEQPQGETFILALRLVFFVAPVILLSLALIVARKYPLTAQVHMRLRKVLAEKRLEKQAPDEIMEEEKELLRRLIG